MGRSMRLRARIAWVVSATVTAAIVLLGAALQVVATSVLLGAVDDDLRAIAATVERDPRGLLSLVGPGRERLGGAAGLLQVVDTSGQVQRLRGPMDARPTDVLLPVDADVLAVARGELASALTTVEVEGVRVRMLSVPLGERFALQVARPIDEVETVLGRLRAMTLLAALVGVLLAALAARSIAGRSIRPVSDLTRAVESVRDGSDLARRVGVDGGGEGVRDEGGGDEVARLALAFDAMLARLEASRLAQERLAADAAHELRTPVTSLRTNIEVLAAGSERLTATDRAQLTADVIGQLDELAAMVDGLVLLARIEGPDPRAGSVDVGGIVEETVAAARRRHPQRAGDLVLQIEATSPQRVRGDARELALAVSAILDNAVKYAPDGPITIAVSAVAAVAAVAAVPQKSESDAAPSSEVRIEVADRGPGVQAELLPHLFERFFRSPDARGAPGSGLGLAIVERVATAHGGRVSAALADPHGLVVTIVLPTHRPT